MTTKNTETKITLDPEAKERLEGVLDAEALDRALDGLDPDQITGSAGLLNRNREPKPSYDAFVGLRRG